MKYINELTKLSWDFELKNEIFDKLNGKTIKTNVPICRLGETRRYCWCDFNSIYYNGKNSINVNIIKCVYKTKYYPK